MDAPAQLSPTKSGTARAPDDPIGRAVAEVIGEVLFGAHVTVTSGRPSEDRVRSAAGDGVATATGPGPGGGETTVTVQLEPRIAQLLRGGGTPLVELLDLLPGAGLRAAAQLRQSLAGRRPAPAMRRAIRDTLATEILACYFESRLGGADGRDLLAETLDYLIELSGTRVEAHDLTHGVVMTGVLANPPRLEFRYPDDLRPVKRAPLLFDGRQSVLVVDPQGMARTELQRHRFDRLGGSITQLPDDGWLDSGQLVAAATGSLGGIGLYVRGDRSIWTFVDGQPLLVRRGEHWTAFPMELAASIANMIGGGPAADIVARAAYMISARPQGAILAIVDDRAALDGVVSAKDRHDLRSELDPAAMRPETRLHHLIDAEHLDEHTLARLAALDGATVLDQSAQLVAYGAVVTSSDSQHEGARTAAARTLSHSALVVLKVSVDGDITIFRDGAVVTTLLGHPSTAHREE
jgi:hypothetical protein